MKATELRIGNYHNYLVKDPIDVRKQWNEVCQIDAYDLLSLSKESDVRYQPIPLTEEWLLKFGFKLFSTGSYCKDLPNDNNAYLAFDLKYNNGYCWLNIKYGSDENTTKINVKYVHQIQNLYFALTNEELTL